MSLFHKQAKGNPLIIDFFTSIAIMLHKTINTSKLNIIKLVTFCVFGLLINTKEVHAKRTESFIQDSIKARRLHDTGMELGQRGDHEGAIRCFMEVYQISTKLYGDESDRLVSPINNIGIQYKNLYYFDKALAQFNQSEILYKKKFGDEYPKLGAVYSNQGIIFGLQGDLSKSLQFQKNALRLLRKDSLGLSQLIQVTKYNLVEVQLKLGFNKLAIEFGQANINTIDQPRLKARMYDLIAQAYRNEGKTDLSEKYYLLAIKTWTELYGPFYIELADEYLAYSALLMAQNKFDKALIYTSKAKEIAIKSYGEKGPEYAEVQTNFGDYYYLKNAEAILMEDFRNQRRKNLREAIQYYQRSIVALVDSFNNVNPFIDPELKNVISEIKLVDGFKKKGEAMEKLADLFLSEFDFENSVKYYKASLNSVSKAIQLIHRLQIGFESEESKLFLSQNQSQTFAAAIDICYKLFKQTKDPQYIERAFEFSERSKSSNLLASVKDMKAKEFGGIPDSLLEKERIFKSNIDNYTQRLFEEIHAEKPDSLKLNTYNAKIFKFTEDYNKLINSFEKSYPRYYAFKYENRVVTIPDVKSRLNQKQALIEYFIEEPLPGDSIGQLYRFVVTSDSSHFSAENINPDFLNDIQSVRDFLVNPNYLFTRKKDFVEYSTAGYRLYEKLIAPFASKISGKDLTIIPHDKLSYLPFDALISQKPDTSVMNFRNLNYLIRDYAINYSYSATLLYDFFDKKKSTSSSVIAFSPAYSDKPYIDPETSTKRFLSPLPAAKDEVKSISKIIKTSSFIDDMAQEKSFKDKAPDFDILHLAMHTIINDSLPMFSKLVFSKPENSSSEDGFLNTYEVYNMKLNARLAVLSACETGSGKLQKGEGVMSMARSFIYAGCPSIVMTLWQIDDQSGARIMEDFYYFLSKGKRKDVALRMAKLKHLESSDPLTSHPHYWMAYVNIGNPEPLKSGQDKYLLIFIGVVGILLVGDWYRRKHKR